MHAYMACIKALLLFFYPVEQISVLYVLVWNPCVRFGYLFALSPSLAWYNMLIQRLTAEIGSNMCDDMYR